MNIASALNLATQKLKNADIQTYRLDAEILMCSVLKKNQAWLIAHSQDILEQKLHETFVSFVSRRILREPIAYITKNKEFYGLDFMVDHSVLIPRAETEPMVEYIIRNAPPNACLTDIGTGSGAIAISVLRSRLDMTAVASDSSADALMTANLNAQQHKVTNRITFQNSNLLDNLAPCNVIAANLPYLAEDKSYDPELAYEPKLALFAGLDGMDCYREFFISFARYQHLGNVKFILCETDPAQISTLISIAQKNCFTCAPISNFITLCKPINL